MKTPSELTKAAGIDLARIMEVPKLISIEFKAATLEVHGRIREHK